MKRKIIRVIIGVVVVALAALALTRLQKRPAQTESTTHPAEHLSTSASSAENKSVPAHYQTEPAASSLERTLAPEKFTGKAQEAYLVVQKAPQLIAQLPCYCYCDRGFGHKSLHSCFVDDHAAHCAVCVDEALLAYNLQKRGLSPQQIREQIIAQYEPTSAP
jgi:hypothetical protein